MRFPQEHGALSNLQACTPHDTPVLYTTAGREVCEGQRLSMPGLQSSMYEWLPIRKFPQLGPYAGPYCPKAHDQRESNHRGGPRIRPDPMPGHQPCHISPRRTGVITKRTHKKIQVAFLTGTRQYRPRGPRDHRDGRPRPRHTGGRREPQKKLKSCTTNRGSNQVTQYAHRPRQ